MKTQQTYANHPLLPLMQLLDGIESSKEFQDRRVEILDAIHLAAPILKDRTPECCRLAKGSYYASHGTATVPFRMARFVESRIKETLDLGSPPRKPAASRTMSGKKASSHRPAAPSIMPLPTYRQLRELLPSMTTIPTLAGRAEIDIHNPVGGHLTIINTKGNRYHVTEANWNHACAIRKSNSANPWVGKLYSNYHFHDDHSVYHAAAILRAIEEGSLIELDGLEAA